MILAVPDCVSAQHIHSWLRPIEVAFIPGPSCPMVDDLAPKLQATFHDLGHRIVATPTDSTDAIITTAQFRQVVGWRDSLLFTARRRFGLKRSPTVFALLPITPHALDHALDHFARALAKKPPQPADFQFPGLAPQAWLVLLEQGLRGGPILSLLRLVQAQSKTVRVILVAGSERPLFDHCFDLVGS